VRAAARALALPLVHAAARGGDARGGGVRGAADHARTLTATLELARARVRRRRVDAEAAARRQLRGDRVARRARAPRPPSSCLRRPRAPPEVWPKTTAETRRRRALVFDVRYAHAPSAATLARSTHWADRERHAAFQGTADRPHDSARRFAPCGVCDTNAVAGACDS